MKKYVCLLCGEIVDEDELTQHLELFHFETIEENFEPLDEDL